MKLSFTTLGCPAWKPLEIPDKVKGLGFDGVELRVHPEAVHLAPTASDDEAKKFADHYRANSLPVMSLMGYSHFAHLDPKGLPDNINLLTQLIHLAHVMNVPFIRTFVGGLPKGVEHKTVIPKIAEILKPLAELAAKNNIKVGLETHDDWTGAENTLALCQAVNSPSFGIIFDILNVIEARQGQWLPAYEALKPHIFYCHLKDSFPVPKPIPERSKHTPTYIGAGQLPLVDVLKRFKKDGYDGYFSFEWEKRWQPEIEEPERAFQQYTYKMRSLWPTL